MRAEIALRGLFVGFAIVEMLGLFIALKLKNGFEARCALVFASAGCAGLILTGAVLIALIL